MIREYLKQKWIKLRSISEVGDESFYEWVDSLTNIELIDYIDAAIVSAALMESMVNNWLPIETAPKDGTLILVAFNGKGVRAVAWVAPHWADYDDETKKIWCVDDDKHGPSALRGYRENDELGWMPLPEPPDAGAAIMGYGE